MLSISTIPPSVARKLGYYVYLYVNPLDSTVFYVGKGKGGRALAHLSAPEKRAITKFIRRIRAGGQEPVIEILAHGLPTAEAAFRVEAAAIDLLGVESLANEVRGWRGSQFGRRPVAELVAQYTRRKAVIREPAILIRISTLYRYGMTDAELYDATRSAWRVGTKRESARYAFAVFEGVVREVYRITGWLPGGTTFAQQHGGRLSPKRGRWEFVGTLAEDSIRQRYVNRYVGHLFPQGAQNPVSYVNVE
jgi:hypothetical protein